LRLEEWWTIGPRLERKRHWFVYLPCWAKYEAERRRAGLSVSASFPKAQWLDHLTLRFLFVVYPEKLQVGIVKEDTAAGRALPGMDITLPFGKPRCKEVIDFWSADAGKDKEMIKFHINNSFLATHR
jgi:hypothetical protein